MGIVLALASHQMQQLVRELVLADALYPKQEEVTPKRPIHEHFPEHTHMLRNRHKVGRGDERREQWTAAGDGHVTNAQRFVVDINCEAARS